MGWTEQLISCCYLGNPVLTREEGISSVESQKKKKYLVINIVANQQPSRNTSIFRNSGER